MGTGVIVNKEQIANYYNQSSFKRHRSKIVNEFT